MFDIAPDLLDRDFSAAGPERAGDISYVRTREGWLSLSVIQNPACRRVIGRAVSNRMKRDPLPGSRDALLDHQGGADLAMVMGTPGAGRVGDLRIHRRLS